MAKKSATYVSTSNLKQSFEIENNEENKVPSMTDHLYTSVNEYRKDIFN